MRTLTGRCMATVLSILVMVSVPAAAAFAAQAKPASPAPIRVGGAITIHHCTEAYNIT